jgi:hypothetical protein
MPKHFYALLLSGILNCDLSVAAPAACELPVLEETRAVYQAYMRASDAGDFEKLKRLSTSEGAAALDEHIKTTGDSKQLMSGLSFASPRLEGERELRCERFNDEARWIITYDVVQKSKATRSDGFGVVMFRREGGAWKVGARASTLFSDLGLNDLLKHKQLQFR